jgi:hypothetical protein
VRPWVTAVAGITAGVLVGVVATGIVLTDEPAVIEAGHFHETENVDPRVKVIRVDPAGDRGKPGTVRGVVAWRFFELALGGSGVSPHQLRFEFTAPADILQIDVSADVNDPRLRLLEFVAGINVPDYGRAQQREGDTFLHVSWSESPPSQMDETVVLPEGAAVDAGDYVGVSAYMGGAGAGDPLRVSPEVVVLYRWR